MKESPCICLNIQCIIFTNPQPGLVPLSREEENNDQASSGINRCFFSGPFVFQGVAVLLQVYAALNLPLKSKNQLPTK